MGIIASAIGVSSNGRTRDFGSLYHGSNPCAPTKINNARRGHFLSVYIMKFFCLIYCEICIVYFHSFVMERFE